MSKSEVHRTFMKTSANVEPTIAPEPRPHLERRNSTMELEEQVRRRAYELYQQRGGEIGSEVQDWLQAEAEIAAGANKS